MVADVATANYSNLGNDASSVKNNDAVKDVENLAKLVVQIDKLGLDFAKDMITGNYKSIKGDAKKDFSKIEENPALSLAIELVSYIAIAASLVGAAVTGGALAFAVVAIVVVMSLATTINSEMGGLEGGASSTLQAIGVPKSVADTMTKIPSFQDISNGISWSLQEVGVPASIAKPIADITTLIIVLAAAGMTGNVGIALMAEGGTLASLAPQIAKDFGAKGDAQEYLTIGLQVAAMALALGGGVMIANGAAVAENSQALLYAAKQIQVASDVAGGSFEVMQGVKDIDVGHLLGETAIDQASLNLIQTMININLNQEKSTSNNMKNITEMDSQMINNFGMVSRPAVETANALA